MSKELGNEIKGEYHAALVALAHALLLIQKSLQPRYQGAFARSSSQPSSLLVATSSSADPSPLLPRGRRAPRSVEPSSSSSRPASPTIDGPIPFLAGLLSSLCADKTRVPLCQQADSAGEEVWELSPLSGLPLRRRPGFLCANERTVQESQRRTS